MTLQCKLYIIPIYTHSESSFPDDVNKNDTLKLILSFSETAAVMLWND